MNLDAKRSFMWAVVGVITVPGGTIDVASVVDQGATFTITLKHNMVGVA